MRSSCWREPALTMTLVHRDRRSRSAAPASRCARSTCVAAAATQIDVDRGRIAHLARQRQAAAGIDQRAGDHALVGQQPEQRRRGLLEVERRRQRAHVGARRGGVRKPRPTSPEMSIVSGANRSADASPTWMVVSDSAAGRSSASGGDQLGQRLGAVPDAEQRVRHRRGAAERLVEHCQVQRLRPAEGWSPCWRSIPRPAAAEQQVRAAPARSHASRRAATSSIR